MINANKLICHPERIVDKRPITADIFLTNTCNNYCQYCTYGRWQELKKKPRYVKYDDFVKYVNILLDLGVKGIILTGGGEPTINPDFDKITEYLEVNNINYGINTNFNILKKIRPNFLKVSLDATNRDEYKRIRGVDAYNNVMKNIRTYRKWQTENDVKTKLGIQCVIKNPKRYSFEGTNFYSKYYNVDVDYIVLRPVESIGGKYYNAKNMENWLYEKAGLVNIADKDKKLIINYKFDNLKQKFKSCLANFAQIALDERGNVLYCCHKPYEIVGHITDKNILNKKAKYKTDMKKCDIPCRLTGCNLTMQQINKLRSENMFI